MSYVQSASASAATSSTTIAKAYTGAVSTGNLLVAVVYWNSASATVTVADNVNAGNWTAIGTPLRGASGLASFSSQLFYLKGTTSAGAGAMTVTATTSVSTTSRGLAVHEYSAAGFNGLSFVQATSATGASDGGAHDVVTTPGTTNGDLVLAAVVTSNSVSTCTGYTLRENANFGSNGTADVTATGGSSSATFGTDAGGSLMLLSVEFGSASTAGAANAYTLAPGPFVSPVGPQAWKIQQVPPTSSGPTVRTVTLSATATTTATRALQVGKVASATSTTSSVIVRAVNAIRSASSTLTASVSKQAGKPVSTSTTSTTSRVLQAGKVASTSSTTATTRAVQAGRILSTSSTGTASRVLQVGKTLSASSTTTATLTAIKVVLVTLSAVVTTAATRALQAAKLVSTTTATTATITRVANALRSATSALAATLARKTNAVRSATSTTTAALTSVKARLLTLSATVTTTASRVVTVKKVTSTVSALGVTLSKLVAHPISTVTTTAVQVAKQARRSLSTVSSVAVVFASVKTAAGIARDLVIRLGQVALKWQTGSPASKWTADRARPKWTFGGTGRSKWLTELRSKWFPGAPQ